MVDERWAPVKGWEGFYSVSDHGRIRRDLRSRGAVGGRILTPKRTTRGYRYVDLSRNDSKVRRLIHQLVAEVFLPARPSLNHDPNHIDGDKANNFATNLEWATTAENNVHARRLGLRGSDAGELNGNAKLTVDEVQEIRRLKGVVGQVQLARRFGVAKSTIYWIHKGRNWRVLARKEPRRA
jgi:hypothetical protein